ncbi:hypothetical protein D3C81_1722630 [compost metagenome]
MGADNDDDAFAAQGLGGVDGVIQHGALAHRVQHLGQRRLHPRALAGGEDDGGPRMSLGVECGHESIRRLVVLRDLAHCRGLREPGDKSEHRTRPARLDHRLRPGRDPGGLGARSDRHAEPDADPV